VRSECKCGLELGALWGWVLYALGWVWAGLHGPSGRLWDWLPKVSLEHHMLPHSLVPLRSLSCSWPVPPCMGGTWQDACVPYSKPSVLRLFPLCRVFFLPPSFPRLPPPLSLSPPQVFLPFKTDLCEAFLVRTLRQARSVNSRVYLLGATKYKFMAKDLGILWEPYENYEATVEWFDRNAREPAAGRGEEGGTQGKRAWQGPGAWGSVHVRPAPQELAICCDKEKLMWSWVLWQKGVCRFCMKKDGLFFTLSPISPNLSRLP